MSLTSRAAAWLGLTRSEPVPPAGAGIVRQIDAARAERIVWTSPAQAPRIAAVFSAVGIIATALEQLPIDLERNGVVIPDSSFLAKPDPDLERPMWIHEAVTALALHGNCYVRTWRDEYGHGIAARILDPLTVTPHRDESGATRYHHEGTDYTSREIAHLKFLRIPGQLLGLGPIQAAQAELRGHIDVTRASTAWFSESGVPSGILKTEQALDQDTVTDLGKRWHDTPAGRTRILTHGLDYARVISPADAQFLENRRFSKTEILDLFGIPASLSLGIDKGDSETYANVSQDWLGFVRFRLMRYVREIESTLTGLLPRGQKARLNLEGLLRADAETRYRIHAVAIDSGVYSAEYARAIEHIPADAASVITPTPKEVTA